MFAAWVGPSNSLMARFTLWIREAAMLSKVRFTGWESNKYPMLRLLTVLIGTGASAYPACHFNALSGQGKDRQW